MFVNMLEKIFLDDDKLRFIWLINTFINPIFARVLNIGEREILLFEMKVEDLEWKDLYFYKVNGHIIGVIALKYKNQNIVYISEFHILPQFQRKWWWTIMMKELCVMLKDKWVEIIYLETYFKYSFSRNFYLKNNFYYLDPKDLKKFPLKDLYNSLVENSLVFYRIL